VVTLAEVQSAARRQGIPPAAVRADWAQARNHREPVAGPGPGSLSRRGLLLGGGAAAAWIALGAATS
jgi:hypothetical protein